jgi:hypothetical protein
MDDKAKKIVNFTKIVGLNFNCMIYAMNIK